MAGVATGVTLAISRAVAHRSAARFYHQTGPRVGALRLGAAYCGSPTVFHRSEASQTLHSASLEAVREYLPTDELHPVRLPGERAVIAIGAFRHDQITSNGVVGEALLPYGEVMVAALVTRRPARPLLPLVAPGLRGVRFGAFVLHLPVTHRPARDGGRLVWGYPKFIADMEFEDSIETLRCSLAEGGRHILTQTIRPGGQPAVLGGSMRLYSALDGELLALDVPMSGIARQRWGPGGGHLELGGHQVADELRALEISPEPFLSRRLTELRLAMTYGQAIGPARQYLGYIGEDRDLGRYVVRYPNEAPIDMYAPFAETAGPGHVVGAMTPAKA